MTKQILKKNIAKQIKNIWIFEEYFLLTKNNKTLAIIEPKIKSNKIFSISNTNSIPFYSPHFEILFIRNNINLATTKPNLNAKNPNININKDFDKTTTNYINSKPPYSKIYSKYNILFDISQIDTTIKKDESDQTLILTKYI